MKVIKEELCFRSYNQENTVVGYLYIPQTEQIRGVLQIVHGMAEHMGRYEEFGKFMAEQGYVVCGHDQVGHGKSALDAENRGYFGNIKPGYETLVEDVHYLQVATARRFRKVPYFLLGHSMGSYIARLYAAKYGNALTGLILSGTGSGIGPLTAVAQTLLSIDTQRNGEKHVNKRFDKLAFGGLNSEIKNPISSYDWITRDPDRLANYLEDEECGFIFTNNGYTTLMDLMYKCNEKSTFQKTPKDLPILLIAGSADPCGNYGKGVTKVAKQLEEAGVHQVDYILYAGARHEILQEINREEVENDVFDWIEETRKKASW